MSDAAIPRVAAVSALFAESSARLRGTRDKSLCGSHVLPFDPAQSATVDSPSAASPSPQPAIARATLHRCDSCDTLILILQLPQPLRFAHAHPPVLGFPGVNGVLGNA